jgi:ubiquinone/menaquinone biosynthesis C-methylase UbiE
MSTKTTKDYVGLAMEGRIATWYARNVGKDIADYRRGARIIAERIPAGSAVLEVAPGPGYLSIELARLGKYSITGLDISKTFVEIATQKAREAGVSIDFREGSVQRMPFGGNVFDGIYCRAAFKNFADPLKALNEMHRVLKPGGQALIIDLRADASDAEIDTCVNNMGLGFVDTLTTKWTFKFWLLKRAYTPRGLEKLAAQSHFKGCEMHKNDLGMEVWLQKASIDDPA